MKAKLKNLLLPILLMFLIIFSVSYIISEESSSPSSGSSTQTPDASASSSTLPQTSLAGNYEFNNGQIQTSESSENPNQNEQQPNQQQNVASFAASSGNAPPTQAQSGAIQSEYPDKFSGLNKDTPSSQVPKLREQVAAEFEKGLSEEDRRIYDNMKEYAMSDFEGTAQIDKDGTMTVSSKSNDDLKEENEVTKIPPGYKVDIEQDTTTYTNEAAKPEDVLEIGKNKIKSEESSTIAVEEGENGNKKINLEGTGDIEIGDKKFPGVQDASFETENDQFSKEDKIISAEFTAANEETYKFESPNNVEEKRQTYEFEAQEGGKVKVDFKNNLLSGEDATLNFNNGNTFESDSFTAKLDSSDKIKEISGKGGEATLTDDKEKSYTGDDLNVFYDSGKENKDLSNFEGNAIGISGDENMKKFKGEVSYENPQIGINYDGLSKETYTKYDERTNFFNTIDTNEKEAKAEITNGGHSLTINNGKIELTRENLGEFGFSESFSAKLQNGKETINVNVDESTGRLGVLSQLDGRATSTALVSLKDAEGIISDAGAVQGREVQRIQGMIDELKSGNAPKSFVDSLELTKINAENRNGYADANIERLKNFIDSNPSSETLVDAKVSLAESFAKRSVNPAYPFGEGDIIKASETMQKQSYSDFLDAKKLYQEVKTGSYLRDDKSYQTASFSLAELYRTQKDYSNAIQEYQSLLKSGAAVDSNAYLGMAQTYLENNDPRRAQNMLDSALTMNPGNAQAAQLKENLAGGIFKNIKTGLGNEDEQLKQLFERQLGAKGFESWWTTPGAGLKAVFLDSGRIAYNSIDGGSGLTAEYLGKQYSISQGTLGVTAFEAANKAGYSPEEFGKLDLSERKKVIGDAMGLNYVSEKEVIDRWMETNPNKYPEQYRLERDSFIKENYGERTLMNDNLVSEYARASIKSQDEIYDLQLLTDSSKRADFSNSDYKFKTGEGYIDPGSLKETWRDTVLDQVNLVNAGLMLAPGAQVTIAGRTVTFAGAIARGAEAIPGVSSILETTNLAGRGAAEALGIARVLEIAPGVAPRTTAVAEFLGKTAGDFGVSSALNMAPGGQYIDIARNFISPSSNGLRAAREIESELGSAARAASRFEGNVVTAEGKMIQQFGMSENTISNLESRGFSTIERQAGRTLFESPNGNRFFASTESQLSQARNIPGISPDQTADIASFGIREQQEAIANIRSRDPFARFASGFEPSNNIKAEIAKEVDSFLVGGEAHSAANFDRLLQQYRTAESHGVTLDQLESGKAYQDFFHAYPRGSSADISRGLDASRSSDGFFFTASAEESRRALVQMGYNPQDIDILRIRVSRNVYDTTASSRPVIRPAPTTEVEAFYVPTNRYSKFNELMSRGLIRIGN